MSINTRLEQLERTIRPPANDAESARRKQDGDEFARLMHADPEASRLYAALNARRAELGNVAEDTRADEIRGLMKLVMDDEAFRDLIEALMNRIDQLKPPATPAEQD